MFPGIMVCWNKRKFCPRESLCSMLERCHMSKMSPILPDLRFPRLPRGLSLFTAAYLTAAIIGAVRTGNGEFVFYIVVLLILVAAVLEVHRRVRLSPLALWCLSVWGLVHMAGGLLPVPESWPINGEIRVLYSWWLIPGLFKFDQLVHIYGFAVMCLVCWEGLRAILRSVGQSNPEPTLGLMVLCVAASAGFGALNEVIEFAATLAVPKTNVGGYANTGWDLVSNLAGAILAAVAIRARWLVRSRKAGA